MSQRDIDANWQRDQTFALLTELSDVHRLIEHGIWSVHQLSGSNDFNHGALQFLSQGFERLLKCTLIALLEARDMPVPTSRELRTKYGHDVVKLHSDVVALASEVHAYSDRPAVQEDLEFMREDADLSRLLQLFADFGAKDRHYGIEAILDPAMADAELEPARIWSSIEVDFLVRRDDIVGNPAFSQDEIHAQINAGMTMVLDRYFRALTRMWSLGAAGPQGPYFASGALVGITKLTDEQLGIERPLTS
ncbi:MAG: hypothetical protein WAO61_07905 [Solirubrobacterales bacterium]